MLHTAVHGFSVPACRSSAWSLAYIKWEKGEGATGGRASEQDGKTDKQTRALCVCIIKFFYHMSICMCVCM